MVVDDYDYDYDYVANASGSASSLPEGLAATWGIPPPSTPLEQGLCRLPTRGGDTWARDIPFEGVRRAVTIRERAGYP